MSKENFYRETYIQTHGWIPMNPLNQEIGLGDFFQIHEKKVNTYGNIFSFKDLEHLIVSDGAITLNEDDWKLHDGIEQVYAGSIGDNNAGSEYKYSNTILNFKNTGSFLFYGDLPHVKFIPNWSELQDPLTIKLTQTDFYFRDLFIVSAIAKMPAHNLAIADKPGATLELTDIDINRDYFESLVSESCEIVKRTDMHTFDRSLKEPSYFFKAKKLVLSDKKREELLPEVLKKSGEKHYKNWYNGNLLNVVSSNDLNKTTCLDFFNWVDTSLNDVEQFF